MNGPRIAYLLKKFPRLSETFVLGEILTQEALGTEVRVFSRRKPDDEPRHPQLEGLRATVEVLPSPWKIDPWRVLFSDPERVPQLLGEISELLRENESWGHERLSGLIAEALYLLDLTRDVDHVHVHFATDSAITAMILHAFGGPTYSITAHAKDIYRNTVDPALLSRLVRESCFTVTVCDANVRHLEGILDADAMKNVRRLYNGIDLASFAAAGAVRRPAEILSVGRLVEKKGFFVLLDALALLQVRGVPFHATLAGDGEERQALAQRVEDLGLTGLVDLAGPLDQGRIRDLMQRATVFCLPCIVGEDGNRDALPTVLLESLASGLPSISTPVTGIPEILGDGSAGVIVPERDVAATADAIQALLEDPARREQLARRGRERCAELFDRTKQGAVLQTWFSDVRSSVAAS